MIAGFSVSLSGKFRGVEKGEREGERVAVGKLVLVLQKLVKKAGLFCKERHHGPRYPIGSSSRRYFDSS